MEQAPVWAVPDLIDDIGLKIDVERTGDMLSRGSLGEESAETVVILGGRSFHEATIGL